MNTMRNALIISSMLLSLFSCHKKDKIKTQGNAQKNDWAIKREGQIPEVYVSKVQGDLIIAGSSTVFPLVEKLADTFREDGYVGNIKVDSIGSGAGFERWTKGETDISNASRPIKQKEAKAAQKIGRNPLEFLIGIDALVVVVNPENDWVDNVSVEMLAKIFSVDKWNDVDSSWPDMPIEKFSPGTDSGTFDYFVEEIFDKNKKPLLSANSLQLSEDDNILSRGIQNSKYGIGYFGYAYYDEAKNALKAVGIAGNLPSEQNIYSNTYLLARPLYMYTSESIMQQKPQVAAFLAYTLNNVESIISEVGYFPAKQIDYAASMALWLKAMEGQY